MGWKRESNRRLMVEALPLFATVMGYWSMPNATPFWSTRLTCTAWLSPIGRIIVVGLALKWSGVPPFTPADSPLQPAKRTAAAERTVPHRIRFMTGTSFRSVVKTGPEASPGGLPRPERQRSETAPG